jgi:hypothetical protein
MDTSVNPTMTEILAKLAALEAANKAKDAQIAELEANANKARGITVKITEKGGIGVYGGRLRKFGATFFATEWHTILSAADEIRGLIQRQSELPPQSRVLSVKASSDWALLRETYETAQD